jgi:CBS domain-containing protein
MATLKDILAGKESKVISVDPRATVMEAAVLMNQYRIGFLVVIDGERPVGVFSERDILRRVVVARLDPGKTLVREVMTSEMLVCNPSTSVEEARSVMKNRRIRHLPVVDDQERLVGLVSIGDLNAFNANAQEQTLHVLHEYIYGRT